jgi:hypothetical protein
MDPAEEVPIITADIYLDRNRRESSLVGISQRHAAALSLSWGDAVTFTLPSYNHCTYQK